MHLVCYYSLYYLFCFFNDTATTEIYTYCHTLSLHDALPISLMPPATAKAKTTSRRMPASGRARLGMAGCYSAPAPAPPDGIHRTGAAAGVPRSGAPRTRPATRTGRRAGRPRPAEIISRAALDRPAAAATLPRQPDVNHE